MKPPMGQGNHVSKGSGDHTGRVRTQQTPQGETLDLPICPWEIFLGSTGNTWDMGFCQDREVLYGSDVLNSSDYHRGDFIFTGREY